MLREDCAGLFPPGDGAALPRRCAAGLRARRPDPLLATLVRQCRRRAPLFRPERERDALPRLVHELGGQP